MNDRLKNFPFTLIIAVYFGYLVYQYAEFQYFSDGQVEQHQVQMKAGSEEIAAMKRKLVEGQKFMSQLEDKKAELNGLRKKASDYQGMLSEDLEVPALIRILLTEAKKIQIRVDGIEPTQRVQKPLYLEQEFKLDIKGNYSQIVLLVQRISQLQRILGIESYSFRPSNALNARTSDQLDAKLSIKAYQYAENAGGRPAEVRR